MSSSEPQKQSSKDEKKQKQHNEIQGRYQPQFFHSRVDEFEDPKDLVLYLRTLNAHRTALISQTSTLYIGLAQQPLAALGILGAVASLIGGIGSLNTPNSHKLQSKFMWGRIGFQSLAYVVLGWSAFRFQQTGTGSQDKPKQKKQEMASLDAQISQLKEQIQEKNDQDDL